MVKLKFDGKKWIELPKNSREGIYYDRKLVKKLDLVKERMRRDFDASFIIDGEEGSGKSTLSFLCGWYIADEKITINNIAEGTEDAIKKLDSLPDGSVLIIDEGSLSFSSKEVMSREQKRIVRILQVIRQKKMCLIIVAPEIFELNKYISVHRTKFLLHVYAKKFNRGYFTYFSAKKKRMLYELGKKKYNSYKKPRSNFYGRFADFDPFGEEYQKLKKKSLSEALKGDGQFTLPPKEVERVVRDRNKQIVIHMRDNDFKLKQISLAIDLTVRTISTFLKENKEETLEKALAIRN